MLKQKQDESNKLSIDLVAIKKNQVSIIKRFKGSHNVAQDVQTDDRLIEDKEYLMNLARRSTGTRRRSRSRS